MNDPLRLPRVGVLVPSSDTTLETELPRLLAGRATVHFTRMDLESVTPAGLAAMEDAALVAVSSLAQIEPDVVLFGCTSGSFFRGAEHETALVKELAARAGAPVVTAAQGMCRSLKARGSRVRLRTPYSEELTTAEVRYLEAAGLTVTSAQGLGLLRDQDISAVPGHAVLGLAGGDDDADVLMVSCTNLPTLHILPALSRTTGLPVVTSNVGSAEAVLSVLSGSPPS